jgi:23S rRNA pseudouridine2457 synthase
MRVIRFWKPFNVLTHFTDKEGRTTLAAFIDVPEMYVAGRLDYDSEGLLLLAENGELNARLTQPRYAHPRTYWVQIERIPEEADLQKLRDGILLNDGITRPAQAKLLTEAPNLPERPVPIRYRKNVPTAWLELTLTEGRNRQVRRMTAAIGHPTLRLVRCAIGDITLAGLQPGEWQFLTQDEIQALKKAVKIKK